MKGNEAWFYIKRKMNVCVMFLLCGAFLTICAVLFTAFFSVNRADDFSNALAIRTIKESGYSHFMTSLYFVKKIYLGWQGTYFSMFLQAMLSPLNYGGLVQLRLVMVCNFCLFVLALYFFEREICLELKMSKVYFWCFFSVSLLVLLAFYDWTEIFTWYTGAVVYSIPLSIGLIGSTLTLKIKNKCNIIAASFLVFCAVGGSLEVTGTICFTS